MKKATLLLLSSIFICLFTGLVFAAHDQYVNQLGVDFSLAPSSESQMDYLPLDPIAHFYGIYYNYDSHDNEINGRWDKNNFTLVLNSKVAELNKKREILNNPVVKINGHIMIPIEFLEKMLNINFRWNPSSSSAIVIKPIGSYSEVIDIFMMTNKNYYNFGQQVVVTMILKNTSSSRITVPFRTSQIFDARLSYQGREIWRYSKGKMFTTALSNLEFEPNESKVYTFTLPDELILTPAQYELIGYMVSDQQVTSDTYYFNVQ